MVKHSANPAAFLCLIVCDVPQNEDNSHFYIKGQYLDLGRNFAGMPSYFDELDENDRIYYTTLRRRGAEPIEYFACVQ